ncbi:hypothetical protein [Nitratireductor basaltis]|uniref:Uncharacterized protein n=1 Tax=Nitratireductor basaltis TaxID=472175 RepID=A0A084UDP6_9HYPH|nr:hypothetical protein [Nitratireductor basaltis]KFB11082.1 hypothetical protein EL18_02124 [Nitratireductor basaltis]
MKAEYLIRKGGYYYRPNSLGYTTKKSEAGRYTKEEAEREASVEPWRMQAIHQDVVPDDPLPHGYRILAPGELDAETLEKAAQVADQYSTNPLVAAKGWDDEQRDYHETGQLDASLAIATAIRSLKGGSE